MHHSANNNSIIVLAAQNMTVGIDCMLVRCIVNFSPSHTSFSAQCQHYFHGIARQGIDLHM